MNYFPYFLCLSIGVSAAEIIEIVDRHNLHRSNVAPTATDMLKMVSGDSIPLINDVQHTGKCIRRFAGIYAYSRYFIDQKW